MARTGHKDLALLTDLYQLTMMQGYFYQKREGVEAIFDLFYRSNPSGSAFSIAAGLEQAIEYIEHLSFSEESLDYLRTLGMFKEEFLQYLATFKFSGDVNAVKEGTVIFPHEPILQVIAPICEAQLVETALLNIINHQSLIATKSARINWAAEGDGVLEFGLRRAQGPDAGIYGARAAVIGGCSATSNVIAGKWFDIPVRGTHAHSWVMSFETELEAFQSYADIYEDSCILLVDTYDTLKQGVPNAITVFNKLKAKGTLPSYYGIRLDSGDLSYLSKEARILLDAAGHKNAVISASSDLDEYLIRDLKLQGSKITLWGVGTNLITSKDCPAFGGVYKLAGYILNGEITPKIKLSDNIEKVTNPGYKKVLRIYDKATGKMKADLITLADETYNTSESLTLFDSVNTWKTSYLEANSYEIKELLVPIFKNGECVYERPSTQEIKAYCAIELNTLWTESRRLINPQFVYVDLSQDLYDLKIKMIKKAKS